MNWLEEEIARNEKRVKKITEHPDPTKLQSNKMLYELELGLRKAQFAAWREGKGCIVAGNTLIEPLLRSLGLQPIDLHGAADKVMIADKYIHIAKVEGFPDNHCDRTVAYIGMCIAGDLPVPRLMLTTNAICDPVYLSMTALAHRFDIPLFCVDVTLEENEDTIKYVASQLEDFIVFAESKVPGAKYDEAKLVQIQNMNRIAFGMMRDIYKLKRQVPCPIPIEDTFRIPRAPAYYPDSEYCLRYWQAFRDELTKRAKEAIVREEKLRVMWCCAAPYFANPFHVLSERHASIPVFQVDFVARRMAGAGTIYGDMEYGRKLTPLEEEARMLYYAGWVGVGQKWVDQVLYVARDLSIDAIVNFLQTGCMPTVGLAKLVADAAERELGIPVLNVEGRQLVAESYNKEKFEGELADFIDMCLQRRKLKS
jgi:benzoyl-CoA reductase/2-hydroxyglutaryl-CoA dehydratase subunit BcrC/BadD/HgdB